MPWAYPGEGNKPKGFVNAHAHLLGAFVRGMGGDRTTTVDSGPDRPTVAVRLVMDEADAYAGRRPT